LYECGLFLQTGGVGIEDIKETQLNHPKVIREKLGPKNCVTIENKALPKGLLSKTPKIPANSTRVVMEQFVFLEKYAPYPPQNQGIASARGKKVSKTTDPSPRIQKGLGNSGVFGYFLGLGEIEPHKCIFPLHSHEKRNVV
jgi:hypothetical protein